MIKTFQNHLFLSFKRISLISELYKPKLCIFFSFSTQRSKEYFVKSTCSGCGSLFESSLLESGLQDDVLYEDKYVSKFKSLRRQEEDKIFNSTITNLDETLRSQLLQPVFEKRLPKFLRDKAQKRLLCQRCHNLIHHSTLSTEFLTHSETLSSADWVSALLKEKNALVIHVIDSIDFPHSYIPELYSLLGKNARIFYVISKIDIICQKKHMLGKIRNYFISEMAKIVHSIEKKVVSSVILTSAVKGWGIDQLITSINEYKAKKSNLYFIGMTNVGKSSIISKFSSQVGYKETPTVSFLPNTTINPININVNKLGNLFGSVKAVVDTPGLSALDRQLFKYVDYNNLKVYVPKKKFPKTKPLVMKAGQSIIIERIIRIDHLETLNIDNRLIITPYTFLPIHLTNTKKAGYIFKVDIDNNIDDHDKTLLENETKKTMYCTLMETIKHKENKDIVIAGFGWINVKTSHSNVNIRIFSPKSKGIILRDSLMQYMLS
ncbi:hypothetical protein PORY_001180 [Pneumocystis oryctolagi]|uniref:Uncharacterized protein n=1 Tax=Pneumocystis oryctolagi TaxID=42067 RepID=A0ACB7CFF7_9ASCO|nr:hypothetical protein PORY_001180 [Pneumocystis oryctolagi]